MITPLEGLKDKKMGFLRQFLKDNKKMGQDEEEAAPEAEEMDEEVPAPQGFIYTDEY